MNNQKEKIIKTILQIPERKQKVIQLHYFISQNKTDSNLKQYLIDSHDIISYLQKELSTVKDIELETILQLMLVLVEENESIQKQFQEKKMYLQLSEIISLESSSCQIQALCCLLLWNMNIITIDDSNEFITIVKSLVIALNKCNNDDYLLNILGCLQMITRQYISLHEEQVNELLDQLLKRKEQIVLFQSYSSSITLMTMKIINNLLIHQSISQQYQEQIALFLKQMRKMFITIPEKEITSLQLYILQAIIHTSTIINTIHPVKLPFITYLLQLSSPLLEESIALILVNSSISSSNPIINSCSGAKSSPR